MSDPGSPGQKADKWALLLMMILNHLFKTYLLYPVFCVHTMSQDENVIAMC